MLEITSFRAFTDNYIWLLYNTADLQAVVIDPGDAEPVLDFLDKLRLNLTAILLTHHHWDHTNGVNRLLKKYSVPVYASHLSTLPMVTHRLKIGDIVVLNQMGIKLDIDEIPGHTLDHIAFFVTPNAPLYSDNIMMPILFTGDTLFMSGCGKVFEGTFVQMWQSLQKIKNYPLSTHIYCGHEYTLSNLKFALLVEPQNALIQDRLDMVQKLLNQNKPTVPGSLAQELNTNPFLRTHIDSVIEAASNYAKTTLQSEVDVFSTLRQWKNNLSLSGK